MGLLGAVFGPDNSPDGQDRSLPVAVLGTHAESFREQYRVTNADGDEVPATMSAVQDLLADVPTSREVTLVENYTPSAWSPRRYVA